MPSAAARPEHALVEHRAQLAQRPEDLDAQHQDDEQRGQSELAVPHAIGALDQRRRRAAGDARRR